MRAVATAAPDVWPVVASTVLAAAAVGGYYALRAASWAVMTDELQVVRLAESIAEQLSPVPAIHGVYYGALSQLYPLLLAPLFATLRAPDAQTAAHALNALLLPSAAWPAFLIARSVTGSRAAALAAAALTAFTPWLVLTSTLLTENAAYPAFVWAVFLCHRALVVPSARRDALAFCGLALAFFARTQLLVVAVGFPLVVLLHEGPRCAMRRHPLLTAAYAGALAVAGALLEAGLLGSVVGNYAASFSGDLLPRGVWSASASHLVHVVIGCGVLPFLLAAAWTALTLIAPERKAAHAFAAFCVVMVPLLTVQVASFDVRFTPGGFNQDRYLCYLAPLFAIGAAAALVCRYSFARLAAWSVAAFGVLTWLVLQFGAYDDETVIFWAAPAGAFHTAIAVPATWLHVSADALLVLAACVLLACALWLLLRVRRIALPAVAVVVAALGVVQAMYVFERYADPLLTREPRLALPRDWIDRAVPGARSVALVPAPRDDEEYWWEAELWNKQADRLLRVDGGPTFSPFPSDDLTIDFERGLLRGPAPSEYLVLSTAERRFQPRELGRLVDDRALKLVHVARPYRLDWATRGLTPDGWTVAGRAARLRIYGSGLERVIVVLAAPKHAASPLDFTLRGGGMERRGWVDPGGARPPVRFELCVPPRGFVELMLRTRGAVRIPDGRLVGLHVARISVAAAGGC